MKIKRKLLFIFLALASVGWLAPAWLGVETMLAYLRTQDIVAAGQVTNPTYSFPHLQFASQCFATAFAWLAVVGFGWSLAIFFRWSRPNNSFKPNALRSTNHMAG
ncbi:MAG: hypothetical protein ACOH1V_13885 [Stenotrophomonas sp.]